MSIGAERAQHTSCTVFFWIAHNLFAVTSLNSYTMHDLAVANDNKLRLMLRLVSKGWGHGLWSWDWGQNFYLTTILGSALQHHCSNNIDAIQLRFFFVFCSSRWTNTCTIKSCLFDHLTSNNLVNPHQSAYCKHHSTEAALLYINVYYQVWRHHHPQHIPEPLHHCWQQYATVLYHKNCGRLVVHTSAICESHLPSQLTEAKAHCTVSWAHNRASEDDLFTILTP